MTQIITGATTPGTPPGTPTEEVSSDAWCTPEWLTQALGWFDLDPCSNPRSTVQALDSYSLEAGQDGLTSVWWGSIFCNPPYSKPRPWCERLQSHSEPWCALVKLDPTTRWWSTLTLPSGMDAARPQWSAFRKRLRFERPDKPPLTANFPSALVWCRWAPSPELLEHLWPPSVDRSDLPLVPRQSLERYL